MENAATELPAGIAGAINLGVTLGQTQAFGMIAGRCSAAHAEGLRKLREEKKYLDYAPDWRTFCQQYLHLSGSQADRIIQLHKEFGPQYFELNQLTRISPLVYRTLEPMLEDGALLIDGETIELNPENSERLTAAVAELRKSLPPRRAPAVRERIASAANRGDRLLLEFKELVTSSLSDQERLDLSTLIGRLTLELFDIEKTNPNEAAA